MSKEMRNGGQGDSGRKKDVVEGGGRRREKERERERARERERERERE